jgi:ABC-type Mn2+/Zn2+ transport system permease subunit
LIGFLASVSWDLPAGPTVITALALILVITALTRRVVRR